MPADKRPALGALALIVVFAALICLRLPGPLAHPRFWAEEGTIFYINAAIMPWPRALLAPFGGYLNLIANAIPIVARHLVRLEYVPWIDTAIGLMFQCFPAIIIACSRDSWLDPPVVRFAALLLIATAPVTEEVYLNTLHSQFHLALCCGLILALEIPGWRLGLFYGVILLLAPLCGPAGCLMAPLFCARAVIDRSPPRALQALLIGAAAAVQFLVFYSRHPMRQDGAGPILLLCIVYLKQIVTPLWGRDIGQSVSAGLLGEFDAGQFPWRAVLVSIIAVLVFAAAVLRSRHAAAIWMFLSACLVTPIAYHNALLGGRRLLVMGVGARYTFLPEVLCALALLGLAARNARPNWWFARGLVAWLVVVGVMDIGKSSQVHNEGPGWLDQAALWRRDHAHPLAIWPAPWAMTLSHE